MKPDIKILLVGGGGYIGSWVTKELVDRGYEVDIIDPFINAKGSEDNKDFKRIKKYRKEHLLKGANLIEEKYEKYRNDYYIGGKNLPDIVFNLAATPLEEENMSFWKQQIERDIPLAWQVASDAYEWGVKRFIYMSSLFAYGDIDGFSCNENTPLNAKTGYGISKACGEMIVKSLFKDRQYNIIRTTSVYGTGDANQRATQIFMNRALQKKPFWVNAGSWPDFIYIKDLVEGIVRVITTDFHNEDFHISGGKAIPLVKFVYEIEKHFDYDIEYEMKDLHNDRPKRGTMDNTKARLLLGWEPRFSLYDGVKEYAKMSHKLKFA